MQQSSGVSEIDVRIVVPRHEFGKRFISRSRPDDHFHVLITNTSKNTTRLWRENCSDGYECLSFEWADSSGGKGLAGKKPIDWTVNRTGFWILAPGESFVWNVYFHGPEWVGFPEAVKTDYEVSMRAIYKSRPMRRLGEEMKARLKSWGVEPERWEAEIWAGRVESPWDTYVYHD